MAHITVYLPKEVESRVRKAAKQRKTTVNKWITEQIRNAVRDSLPESFLGAAGAVPDFPGLEEIRRADTKDSPREAL